MPACNAFASVTTVNPQSPDRPTTLKFNIYVEFEGSLKSNTLQVEIQHHHNIYYQSSVEYEDISTPSLKIPTPPVRPAKNDERKRAGKRIQPRQKQPAKEKTARSTRMRRVSPAICRRWLSLRPLIQVRSRLEQPNINIYIDSVSIRGMRRRRMPSASSLRSQNGLSI